MFQSLSVTEILTIAVVALIVVGPRHLPGIARRVGRYVAEIKRAATGFRQDLEREVAPLKEPLDELKQVRKEIAKPVSEVRKTLDEAASTAKNPSGSQSPDKEKSPPVRWIAPEPKTGVSPSEAWEGVSDPVPESTTSDTPSGGLPPQPPAGPAKIPPHSPGKPPGQNDAEDS